ncbi:prolactin-releasing peptide receptor-like [Pollicipes pollicipes]|uniref:prolactin-releasing peptide receptor-like n=1 Tax=Pollicipes pollicipes TaxID=41117 RepID=UPI00188571DE|nr:prolactin-releasing peptide receptor-like [Pollicipes pollicipes]
MASNDGDSMPHHVYHRGQFEEEFLRQYANNSLPLFNRSRIIYEEKNFVLTIKVQIIFYMVYSIIFFIGVFGNFLVVYAVLRNKAMRTVTNYFILNLALSDILLCVLCVPFTPLYTFLGRWIFGKVLCHLVTCTQGISIYISSLTLTAIAIDRFVVIIYPFRSRMLTSTCTILILCTWLFSMGATLPYAYFVEHRPIDSDEPVESDVYVCQEDFPEDIRLTFGSITTILQFVIPFLIMTITYTLISFKLSSRARSKPGSKSVRKEQADRERKKRTNRMLISMVTVFGLSWLPLNVMNLLDDISSNLGLGWENWQYFHLFFFVAHAIAMSSTCYNPFLYAWLNETFRKEFKEILPCFRSSGGETGAISGVQPNGAPLRPTASRAAICDTKPTDCHVAHVHATFSVGNENVVLLTAAVVDDRRASTQTTETATDTPPLVTDL